MRRRVTAGVVLVTFLVALEATVVSTAMPSVVADLGGLSLYSWVFSGYLSAVALTGPAWGKLADRWGSRPAYLASAFLFLVGSLLAGTSHTMKALILARVVQGLGGGGITPLGQVILAQTHNLEERARMQGVLVAVYGIATIAGPPVGGYLVTYAHWRWVFFLNLPFGLLGMAVVALFLPLSPGRRSQPFDLTGLLLFLISYSSLLWACQSLRGGFAGLAWSLTLALALLLGRHQLRQSDPFLPLHLRRYAVFGNSLFLAPLLGVGVFGGISYLPLYFQGVLGQSAEQAGRSMIPLLLAWSGTAAIAPRLYLRKGTRWCVLLASLALTAAFGILWALPTPGIPPASPPGDPWALLIVECCIGMGGGLSFTPLTLAVQAEVPPESLGSATSAVVFLRMLGASLGTSLMGMFLPAQLDRSGPGPATVGPEVAALLAAALSHAFLLGLIGSAMALAASLRLPRAERDSSQMSSL